MNGLSDFAQRLLGFPQQMFGAQPGQPVNMPDQNAAAVAQPTMQQMQDQDMHQAGMQRLGQLGLLFLAAGQRMTPKERATLIAQAPQYLEGMQRDAMTAAQARLLNMQNRSTQDELARTEALRQKFNDPAYLKSIGLTPEQAQALGPSGIQKLLENQALANTPEALLDRKFKQAQIENLQAPKIGPIGQDQDGNTIYGDQHTGQPINTQMTPTTPISGQPQTPAGVNVREFRKQQAQEAAKLAAAATQQKQYEDTQFKPAAMDYASAVKAGIEGGAFGPLQANEKWRSITSNSEKEALRQRVEQAEKRMAFELAKRASGGKLDSKGLTDTELEQYRKQLIPLYSSDPQMLLDSFTKNYGLQSASPTPINKVPQGVTIRRLGD